MFWNAVLWGALGLGLAALLSEVAGLRMGGSWAKRARVAQVALAATLVITFLALCVLFLLPDLSYEYVWLYTATWVPWEYRLAGAWTGREGSLLLWAAAMAVTTGLIAWKHRIDDSPAKAWTRIIMLSMLSMFLLAIARQDTFAPTPDYLLTGRPAGNGINPTLRSPFILIHPPMMFVAYALTIVPAAAGIAHMVTGTHQWSRIAATPSRIGWVVYTFAMGLGGIWAYYTLGFGGYWAWDPVEVANLLPWLALTIYVHAAMIHARTGDLAESGPILAILPFVLTVFSTVSTRSGLWVSVHAFTDPTNAFNPDAAARLLGILGIDASLGPYFAVMLATLLVGLALWTRRLSLDGGTLPRASNVIAGVLAGLGALAALAPAWFLGAVFELGALTGRAGLGALALLVLAILAAAAPMLVAEGESKPMRWTSIRGLAIVSVLLLSLSLVVALLWHFAAVNGWSEAFWDERIPWLLTPTAMALMVLLLHGHTRRDIMWGAIGATVVLALVGFLLLDLGAFALVMAAGVFVAALIKMYHVGTRGTRRHRVGAMLLVGAAILNIAFWFNPPSSLLGGLIHLHWPIQVPMGALAMLGLWGAHRVALGHAARWPIYLNGVLGGFYLAPVLAVAAWWLRREAQPRLVSPARVRTAAVYGTHLAVAVLFIGYAASTYYETKETNEFTIGDVIAPDVQLLAITATGAGQVESLDVAFGDGQGTATGQLYYEPQAGAYFPLPGTLRAWTHDTYVQVDAVCWNELEKCGADDWVTAYESSFPVRGGGDPQSARLTVHTLPGISFVWAALAMFVGYGIPLAAIADTSARKRVGRAPTAPTVESKPMDRP